MYGGGDDENTTREGPRADSSVMKEDTGRAENGGIVLKDWVQPAFYGTKQIQRVIYG